MLREPKYRRDVLDYPDEEVRIITFHTRKECDRARLAFNTDRDLLEIPRIAEVCGYSVPKDAIPLIRAKGFRFRTGRFISAKSLSSAELAERSF